MSSLPGALEARALQLVGHTDLWGKGDGMQIMRSGDFLYVGHMGDFGVGTSVVDVTPSLSGGVTGGTGLPVTW